MIYCFQAFELDEELFQLRHGDAVRKLNRKSFDLLRYLLEHSGRVIPKEELFGALWGREHVGDNVLPVHVRTIRKALGEGSESILRTVRGRGYTIVCAVERIESHPVHVRPRGGSSLAGRDAALAMLREEYGAAAGGSTRVVLVHGPVGIGKTRVLEELGAWARERTPLVLGTSCEGDPGAPEYWPLTQLLRAGRERLGAEPLRQAVARSGLDLARARTGLQEMFRRLLRDADDRDAVHFQIRRALERLIERACEVAPLVLMIDDLHRADEATIAACIQASRGRASRPLLLVATYRDEDVGPRHPITRSLAAAGAQTVVRHLRLDPLDAAAVASVARDQLGAPPASALLDALCERTGGNPFFLHELLSAWKAEARPSEPDAQALALRQVALPPALREAMQMRVEQLSEPCRELLTWAAVVGMQFSVPLLAHVSGLASEQLLRLLSEAVAAHAIHSRARDSAGEPLAPGHYRFVHVALRETLYEGLTGPERLVQHREVALALERAAGRHDDERLPELAHHFYQAAATGVVDQAVDYCLAAARRALARGRHEDAVKYADWADRAESLRVPRDALRSCAILLTRAETLRRAGAYREARDRYVRATELARAIPHGDFLGLCALGLAACPPWTRPPFDSAAAKDRRVVVGLAQEALALPGRSDLSLEVKLRALLLRGPDAERDDSSFAELRELAEQAQSSSAAHHVSMARLVTWEHPSTTQAALDLAKEMLSRGRDALTPARTFAIYEQRVLRLLTIGDIEAADRDIAAMHALAETLRIPAFVYSVARLHLARALGDGDLDRASELLAAVNALAPEERDASVRWMYRLTELWVVAASESAPLEPAHFASLHSGGDLTEPAPAIHAAVFYMSLGDRRRAAAFLAHALASGLDAGSAGDGWLWHLCACADVAAYLRDTAIAARIYDALLPYSALNAVSSLALYRGAVASCIGRLALVLRRFTDAREQLEAALDLESRIGARIALLITERAYARLLNGGSDADRSLARELNDRAQQRAHALGATGMLRPYGAGGQASAMRAEVQA